MKLEAVLRELEAVAEQLSIRVKYEVLNTSVGPGGLCRVNREYRVIIDKRAPVFERVATLARALGRFDLTQSALSNHARAAIARYAERRAS